MRFFKLFLISILVFAILLFLMSLLLPTKANVERSGVIDAPMQVVYSHISDLREWPQWNPWANPATTGAPINFSAVSKGEGAYYTWTSTQNETRVTGKVTIIGDEPNRGVHYKLTANDMRPVIGTIELKPSADGKGTAILWRLQTELGWLPWWKLKGFLADRLTGPSLEDGLTKLKTLCEGKP
jgi:hypothetical protein